MDMIDATLTFEREYVLPKVAETDLVRWIALSRVPGLGCVSFKKLAGHFDDPTEALSVSSAALAEIQGLDQNVIDGLRNFSAWGEAEKEIIRAEKACVKIVPFTDSIYPARLRMIPDPPPLLYLKGEIRGEDEKCVVVVGLVSTRGCGCRVAGG